LIKEIGEDNWNKLSDEEKQRRMVEIKLKEKRLREEGRVEEATQLYGDLSEDNESMPT